MKSIFLSGLSTPVKWLIYAQEICGTKSNLSKIKTWVKTKFHAYPENFCTARDFRKSEYLADIVYNQVFKKPLSSGLTNFLKKSYGTFFVNFFVKKCLVSEISVWKRAEQQAIKYQREYQAKNKFYIIPERSTSLKVYNKLRKHNKLAFKAPFEYLLATFIVSFLKYVYFITRLISFPFIHITKLGTKSIPHKKHILGFHYYDGNILSPQPNSSDFFIDNQTLKKTDIIYLVEETISTKALNDLNASGYDFLILEKNINKLITLKEYLLSFFPRLILYSLKYAYWGTKHPFIIADLYRNFRLTFYWNAFYSHHQLDKTIKLMIAGDITSSIIHQKNSVENYFLFTSPSQHIIPFEKESLSFNDCLDYTHMFFDKLVSDPLSISWFKSLKNEITEYISIGPVFSDTVLNSTFLRNDYFTDLNIPATNKLVTFFDNTSGFRGVMNDLDLELFLKAIKDLIANNPSIYFGLKTKKTIETLLGNITPRAAQYFSALQAEKRFILLNNHHNNDKNKFNPFVLMGISDVIVSFPLSSVTYTAFAGKKPVVLYDPCQNYNDDYLFERNLPNVYASNFEKLQDYVKFWLESDEQYFNNYYEQYLKNKITNIEPGQNIRALITELAKKH